MAHFTQNETTSGSEFVHSYAGISDGDLAKAVDDSMKSDGYKLKSGEVGNGTYVKGSRVARILLGAFHKYFEFYVHAGAEGDNTRLTVRKTTSGMSGGVIGMNQVKSETARLNESFKSL